MSRAAELRKRLEDRAPDLNVELHLYSLEEGGRSEPIDLGYGCPCLADKDVAEGWDGFPLVDEAMLPGEKRQVGFVFLPGREAVAELGTAERFYLWEGRLIGEAKIVS